MEVKSNITHPEHYTKGQIECIDAIKSAVVGKTGIEAVCVANVIKYLWRYESKNGIEDIKKAEWYLQKLIQEKKRLDTDPQTMCEARDKEEKEAADNA